MRQIFKQSILALILLVVLSCALSLTSAQDSGGAPAVPALTPTPVLRIRPYNTITNGRTTVELYFPNLPQGRVGLIRAYGDGMAGGRARFLDKLIDFFPSTDGYYALLAVRMEQIPREYELDIFTWFSDNAKETLNTKVEVKLGSFIREDVTLTGDKAYLADAEIERNELARMESIFSTITPEHLWDDKGFQLPVPGGKLTSPFGVFRTFNATIQTRHTGWDIRATLGQPVQASASGKVAFAGLLDIRGNCVVIDHGYGIFTTYSHFAEVHVTRGQTVSAGQILGTVGNTGRTSGPHFHWEVAVNDVYVDASAFIQMWLPGK
jgi:murein DD-endopeptidase MepM/ murein hydrolase activator NlpD